MQSDWKEVYKITGKRTEKSEQQYKDIGNFVFNALYTQLRRPKTLITKLKGVGTWYLRRQRMQTILDKYPMDYSKKPEDFHQERGFLSLENKKEIYKIFEDRLEDYKHYLEERKKIKEERNEFKTYIQPNDREY